MTCAVRRFNAFDVQFKKVIKSFPKSKKDISAFIDGLCENPTQGDRYPGFGELHVQKIRVKLKAYGIGQRGGLRIIWLYSEEKEIVVPLSIYKKGRPSSEDQIKKLVLNVIKDIAKEMQTAQA